MNLSSTYIGRCSIARLQYPQVQELSKTHYRGQLHELIFGPTKHPGIIAKIFSIIAKKRGFIPPCQNLNTPRLARQS